MVLIVGAALAGVFSVGPVSWSAKSDPDSEITLRYERLLRRGGPTELSISMPGTLADPTGAVSLWVSDDYLELVNIDSIVPQPDSATSVESGVLFDFAVDGREEDVDITFSITPDAMGLHRGSLGLVDGSRIAFRQLIYP